MLWIFALALLVRLGYLAAHSSSALFAIPLLDGKYYETAARVLLEGGDPQQVGGAFRPWLYPAFLALCHSLGGAWGSVLALGLQHLMGALTATLVAWLAMGLYRRPAAGWIAGLLYILAAPPLFFEGELLITALFTFLVTVWLALTAGDGPQRSWRWIAAGLVLALAAQARPNVLVLTPAFLFPLLAPPHWLAPWRLDDGRGPAEPGPRRAAALGLASLVAGLALAALLQRPLWGGWQWLPSSGGINLYLGNGTGADGMVPRQERWVTYGEEYRDSVEVFAEAEYRRRAGIPQGVAVAPAEISRFWIARTLEEIAREPGRWLVLMGHKLLYLGWNHEIPNNLSFEFFRHHEMPVLRWLPIRWWLLMALALPGLVLAWRSGDRRRLYWLLAWLGLGALAVLAFFVNARYRIPLWPAMAVLAGGGLLELFDSVSSTLHQPSNPVARRRAVVLLGTALALAAGSLLDRPWATPEHPERDFFYRSLARLEKGDLVGAEADARSSLELAEDQPATHFQLAAVAMARGDDPLAYQSLRRAAELAPDEPRVYNNLAVLAEHRGHLGEAYRGYIWALAVSRDTYAPAMVNAALLELRAGFDDRAAVNLARAEAAGFDGVPFDCARAFLARRRGEVETARSLLERAQSQAPETTARLVREHRIPIAPSTLDLGPAP